MHANAASLGGPLATDPWRRAGHGNEKTLDRTRGQRSTCFYPAFAALNSTITEEAKPEAMDVRHHRSDLFPEIEPFACGRLPLDERHVIHWEQAGNPRGKPVLFLHGGPGAGASPAHRRFFDPRFYRIVIFDQRGCGRSTPYGDLTDNSTQHLVADVEALRRHLDIERWLLFGGSWGATLALAYGIRWPAHCLGFILRGSFLGTRREIDWFLHGMGTFFPEAARAFYGFLPEAEHADLLTAYYRRLTDPDPAVHLPAAVAWCRYESACSNLIPREETSRYVGGEMDAAALALARIEAHYFMHDTFLADGELLANVSILKRIPAILIHGRYDMVCPIASSDSLARAWPGARFIVVPDAGHSAMEPGIRTALVRATESMKTRLARSE